MSTPVFFWPPKFRRKFFASRALSSKVLMMYIKLKVSLRKSNYVSHLYIALFYKKLNWVQKFQFIDFREIFKTAGGTVNALKNLSKKSQKFLYHGPTLIIFPRIVSANHKTEWYYFIKLI